MLILFGAFVVGSLTAGVLLTAALSAASSARWKLEDAWREESELASLRRQLARAQRTVRSCLLLLGGLSGALLLTLVLA